MHLVDINFPAGVSVCPYDFEVIFKKEKWKKIRDGFKYLNSHIL